MKRITLVFLLIALSVLTQAQTQPYKIASTDSIQIGKTTGTGGTSLYGKVYLKNVSSGLSSDSILTVRNGRIFKVATVNPDTTIYRTVANSVSLSTLQTRLNAKQALLSGTGIVKSTSDTISYLTDNSTNWNTAYTYSQVGHLPLTGGTLTGDNTFVTMASSTGTSQSALRFTSSLGDARVGLDNASGTVANGSPYALNLYHSGNYPIQLSTSGLIRYTISGSGAHTIGALSGSGNVIAGGDDTGLLGKIAIGSGLSLSGGTLSATGGSAGTVTGSGTAGKLTKWNSASDVGNSIATESGTTISVAGTVSATTFSGAGTSLTGTASSLTAGTVTTNANLTGAVTSEGNTSSLGSFTSSNLSGALTDETGTGNAVFSASPALTGNPTITGDNAILTLASATGTSQSALRFTSGLGDGRVGIDNSAGTVAGGSAYALNLINTANYPLQLGTNGVIQYVIDGAGKHTIKSAPANSAGAWQPLARSTQAGATLGDIEVAPSTGSGSLVLSNSPTFTGTVSGITASMVGAPSGSGTSTGTNTGDQTTITGNAGTATALQTARTISGTSFDGTANITLNNNGITNGQGYVTASTLALTGDVTSTGSATTIAANAVTNAKAAQMATKTYKGRTSALTGNAEDVPVATLKTDLVLVKGDVGLDSVDNTSDASKPVSTAQQTALDLKANLASPALTGTPTAPTATAGTNTTQVATTAFVQSAVSSNVTSGTLTYSGDGSTTVFATDNLDDVGMVLTARSAAASGPYYITSDNNGCGGLCNRLIVTFLTAPASGTNNITFNYLKK